MAATSTVASCFLSTTVVPSSSISNSKLLSLAIDHSFFPGRRKYIPYPSLKTTTTTISSISPKASSASAPSGTQKLQTDDKKKEEDERVQQVHTVEEFETALRSAGNKLVVVEYAASHSYQSRKMYPVMVQLSRTCGDVEFLLVMGDESDETKELCRREGIDKVPHFSFYKGMEKVHEEEGIGPDQLMGDVLYYGDSHSSVIQLHCRQGRLKDGPRPLNP